MNYENGNKNVFGFVLILESKVENSIIYLVYQIFHMKNQNNQLYKLRILLFSTFDSKMTERPKIFLWQFS